MIIAVSSLFSFFTQLCLSFTAKNGEESTLNASVAVQNLITYFEKSSRINLGKMIQNINNIPNRSCNINQIEIITIIILIHKIIINTPLYKISIIAFKFSTK